MRRILLIIVVFVFIVCIFYDKEQEEIRVRIVPNSDNKEDLFIKEKIKSITICYLKEAYDKDYNTYINNISVTIDDLKDVINKEINAEVLITFDNHTLYNKTYNNNVIKNSNELTLYIEIGEGKGSNWWGTVYPDFLLVNGSEVMKYESIFVNIFKKIKGANEND